MDPINSLLLGLMGAVIVVVIYYMVKLLRVDPTQFEALRPIEIEVIAEPEEEEEKTLPAE